MNKNFSDILKDLRESEGLSLRDVASATKLSRSSLSRWELADAVPTINQFSILCDFFKVSMDYLSGRTQNNICKAVDLISEKEILNFVYSPTTQKELMLKTLALVSLLVKESSIKQIAMTTTFLLEQEGINVENELVSKLKQIFDNLNVE